FALRLPVGGPAVMAEQLAHLQRKATRPYLTLRVVPAARGGHAAAAGAFRLMEFAEFRPVAYLRARPPACSWRSPRRSPPTGASWGCWPRPPWARENQPS
ncbi:MAG: Scr1 family TA system antitoxin-like transcriptional regulator, partial [Pseudonocardiaceae bacterium]